MVMINRMKKKNILLFPQMLTLTLAHQLGQLVVVKIFFALYLKLRYCM